MDIVINNISTLFDDRISVNATFNCTKGGCDYQLTKTFVFPEGTSTVEADLKDDLTPTWTNWKDRL